MRINWIKNSFPFFATLLLLSGCNNDDADPVIENEEELITTVILTFSSDTDTFTAEWNDEDGDGAMEPVVDDILLESGQTYTVALELRNESVSPAEDITAEIEEESEEHQFFLLVSDNLDLQTTYADEDADGNPIGLSYTVTAGAASSGTLTVLLRHEPNKSAEGVAQGDPENAGGETDIETNPPFDVTIQ